jgi:hypothetical protein
MAHSTKSAAYQNESSLAELLQAQRAPFVEAATALFRLTLEQEYPRIRGYMLEQQTSQSFLNVRLALNFDPKNLGVRIETTPEFSPPTFVQASTVKLT